MLTNSHSDALTLVPIIAALRGNAKGTHLRQKSWLMIRISKVILTVAMMKQQLQRSHRQKNREALKGTMKFKQMKRRSRTG